MRIYLQTNPVSQEGTYKGAPPMSDDLEWAAICEQKEDLLPPEARKE